MKSEFTSRIVVHISCFAGWSGAFTLAVRRNVRYNPKISFWMPERRAILYVKFLAEVAWQLHIMTAIRSFDFLDMLKYNKVTLDCFTETVNFQKFWTHRIFSFWKFCFFPKFCFTWVQHIFLYVLHVSVAWIFSFSKKRKRRDYGLR